MTLAHAHNRDTVPLICFATASISAKRMYACSLEKQPWNLDDAISNELTKQTKITSSISERVSEDGVPMEV